jgi:hypothetical protein
VIESALKESIVAFAPPTSWKVALILALGLLALAALTIGLPSHSFTGTITDSMCPKGDHSELRRGPTDVACMKACVHMYGASYVLYDGKATYLLSDQNAPEQFAGIKVRIIGTLDARTDKIQVDSIIDKNIDSLAAAYLAVAAIFFAYLFSVARRTAHLEEEIARVAMRKRPT